MTKTIKVSNETYEKIKDQIEEEKVKEKKTIKMVCNKCGKEQPIDKKQSNKNWKVYMNVKYCKCGGKFEIQF